MSDIVKMLRALADEHYEMLRDIHKPLLAAAAEIERLRALVSGQQTNTDTAVAAVMSLMEWEQSTGKEAVARQIVG